MPRKFGPEFDIVCHRRGLHLYVIPAIGAKTYFSPRSSAQTPLDMRHAEGVTKEKWADDDIVQVCTKAEWNRNKGRVGWLQRQRDKALAKS